MNLLRLDDFETDLRFKSRLNDHFRLMYLANSLFVENSLFSQTTV